MGMYIMLMLGLNIFCLVGTAAALTWSLFASRSLPQVWHPKVTTHASVWIQFLQRSEMTKHMRDDANHSDIIHNYQTVQ